MTTDRQGGGLAVYGMRWGARLLGLIAIVPFVVFAMDLFSDVTSPALSWRNPQGMPLFVALAVASVGVIVAWRWEMIGGIAAAVGALAIVVLVFAGSGFTVIVPAVLVGAPFLVAGLLYMGCCARSKVTAR